MTPMTTHPAAAQGATQANVAEVLGRVSRALAAEGMKTTATEVDHAREWFGIPAHAADVESILDRVIRFLEDEDPRLGHTVAELIYAREAFRELYRLRQKQCEGLASIGTRLIGARVEQGCHVQGDVGRRLQQLERDLDRILAADSIEQARSTARALAAGAEAGNKVLAAGVEVAQSSGNSGRFEEAE